MKKSFLIISLSLLQLLVSNSCKESNLDVKPLVPTENTFFETENQFQEGVLGVYSKLVFFENYRGDRWIHDVVLLPDDDLTSQGNFEAEIFSTINPVYSKSSDYFKFLYQMISRANAILEIQQQKGDQVYKDPNLRKIHRGELLFLRSYANFMLWNLFGTAPLANERITDETKLYPSNSTGTQLLDQAITDLTEAADLLPASWPDDMKGRVTAGSALGLLGKSLLYRATVTKSVTDYTAALTQLNRITGYELMPNYGDNFSPEKENNKESLFEVQLGNATGGNNAWTDTDLFGEIGDLSGYRGFFDNNWSFFRGEGELFIPTQSLVSAFSEGDPRRKYTISDDGTRVRKYVIDAGNLGGPSYMNNTRVIRYADVLLMKAEALVQSSGSTTEAISLINQIRARARNSATPASATPADRDVTETNRDTIMEWIREERRLELAFEQNRWFDLRRWHLGGQIDLKTWNFSSVRNDFDFEEKNLNYPIPFGELQMNKNLRQNIGFN